MECFSTKIKASLICRVQSSGVIYCNPETHPLVFIWTHPSKNKMDMRKGGESSEDKKGLRYASMNRIMWESYKEIDRNHMKKKESFHKDGTKLKQLNCSLLIRHHQLTFAFHRQESTSISLTLCRIYR